MAEIEVKDCKGHHALVIKSKVKLEDLPRTLGELYGELFGYIGSKGIAPLGAPFVDYSSMDPAGWDIEAGVYVPEGTPGQGRIETRKYPPQKCIHTLHLGPFDTLKQTYDGITDWANKEGLEFAGGPRELYLTPPNTEPSKMRTEIVWPVRKKT
jgi:effector-binding domain-containing protein